MQSMHNMSMQLNEPRFDWEVKDRLSELEQFKQECTVLFQGPLSKMKDPQQVGLVVNLDRKTMYNDFTLYGCNS